MRSPGLASSIPSNRIAHHASTPNASTVLVASTSTEGGSRVAPRPGEHEHDGGSITGCCPMCTGQVYNLSGLLTQKVTLVTYRHQTATLSSVGSMRRVSGDNSVTRIRFPLSSLTFPGVGSSVAIDNEFIQPWRGLRSRHPTGQGPETCPFVGRLLDVVVDGSCLPSTYRLYVVRALFTTRFLQDSGILSHCPTTREEATPACSAPPWIQFLEGHAGAGVEVRHSLGLGSGGSHVS